MERTYNKVSQNVICHSGVKGQKWGERRYQNPDGTLTEEGRIHYGYGPARAKYVSAKEKYRLSKDKFNDTFNRAYKDAEKANGIYFNKFKRDKYNNAYENSFNKFKKAAIEDEKAKKEYKEAKKEYKQSDEYKERRNKAIKIGAGIVAAGLAAYGAYKVADYIKNKKVSESGKNTVNSILKDTSKTTINFKNYKDAADFDAFRKGSSRTVSNSTINFKNYKDAADFDAFKKGASRTVGNSTINFKNYKDAADFDAFKKGSSRKY